MGGKKKSKSMSGSYSMKGTAPVGVGVKKGSLTTNGNGPPPLSYPADPPDDENMNEIIDENVNLTVVLPDGSQKQQTIEPNIPMMDLLINLSASNKLNPAAHSLVVLTGDKWKQIDFKANKTIGLLAGEDRQVSVQIIKKKVEEKVRPKSTAQPFEMTYRFTVNLPHNQKKVLRISPKLTLGEVRQLICKEKNFDPSRYVFLLPGNPNNSLEDSVTVGDLKTSEINFVSIGMIEAASSRSMPNLAFAAARANKDASETRDDSQFMPSAGEKKAKRGFLSFLGKKDKKFKPQQQDTEIESRPKKSESFNVRTGRDSESVQARPKTMYHEQSGELEHFGISKTTGDLHRFSDKTEFRKSTGSTLMAVNENVILSTKTENVPPETASSKQNKRLSGSGAPPKKSAKKRAAPPPPQMNKTQPLTVQVEIDVHSKLPEENRIEIPAERVHSKKNHSRNSSDSSGYHELTVSGAESPDANKTDNLQTTLDTTSIDSAEHFNGDSGIRDMSPVNQRSTSKVVGDVSRDSSVDIDKPLAPGKKKKRAPLPPPGMTAGSVVTSETKISPPSQTQESTEIHSKMDKADEFEALQAMEEVTMKFNIEDSDEDDDLRMVEDSSIHSEDIDIDVSHRQRPPTFVAPPPPTEPPPEDSEPVDLNMMVNQVDKIDIGVGEDTTSSGPDSANSSPMSIPRRGSRSSNSSINTLEDLSLAFAQTIEAGEEALGIDSDNDSVQEELKRAMPEFKDNISKLTQDGDEEGSPSSRSQMSEQAEDSDQSFIIHETSKDENKDEEVKSPQGNRESSEITYDFTIDAVPSDFQNEKDEESDESFFVEETIILPAAPGILDFGSPRKIPDLESPKEHKVLSLPTQEEIPADESVPTDYTEDEVETAPVVEEKPPEKEEFVLTFDELSNVDFSASNPKEQRKLRRDSNEVPRVNYRIEFRSSADFDTEAEDLIKAVPATVVNEEPVFNDDGENSNYDNGAKTKCSELSFSPDYEGEAEHMLEEKSISMINLPAQRTPVKDSNSDNNGAPSETYASSTKIVLSASQSPSSQVSETSPRKDDSFDSNSLMQAQYNQLQQQFTMWQNQLVQNQKLLASQGASDFSTNQMAGKDDPSNLQLQQLQLQIQMQQQMMLQLQQSMQALALQNTLQTLPQTVNQPLVATGTLQSQQIPPPPPSTQIFTKDNEKYRPPSPEEEMPRGHIKVLSHSEPPAAPAAPPLPTVVTSKPKPSKADAKYSKPKQKRFERELDPREQLMLDIRNFGKKHLHKTNYRRFQSKRPTGINDEEPIFV
ncbi:protein cordon-bleu-like isoform X4 [Mercenaria mercenaria]|uniref:protein cordon-bleu-like isoform X4 n=1 Tax=Mercenaria mercenaria TaxID=6596 RepID=UPI00234F06B5|nr:protein cordon-bleu-like isoform X4 [Mercenaria mercenaria]